MKCSIITIGDEILIGQIVDTNSSWMAAQLNLLGIDVVEMRSVGDDLDQMVAVLKEALLQSDLVLVPGGLGPTKDD
ncbi:MAG TPA: molybdopterin-binding protein, partial [Saprospiraceae bacterium]|nr:molybdopterin-binding protein [Saprospiraceae bacterium]